MLENLVKDLINLVAESDSRQTDAGTQRERNHRYYSMEPLGNEMPGRSRYIDPAVMDNIESNKAFMREVFFSGRRTAKFLPTEGETQKQADAKTAYVERQLKLNDWFRMFSDSLHDAYVAKRCVIHAEWVDEEDTIIFDAVGADERHLQWQIQQQADLIDVDLEGVQQNEDGTLTGQVRLITDAGKINLRLIKPEKYHRDPYANSPETATYLGFEEEITRGELIMQGIDPSQIDGMDHEYRARRSEEDMARRAHDGSWNSNRRFTRTDTQELVTTHWMYTWMDLSEYIDDAPDDVRLYKVRFFKNEVMRFEDGRYAIKEVSEMPFFEWEQYRVSHASSGMCAADVMAPLQKVASVMKRAVIDNQAMVNSTRWEVAIGSVKNLATLADTTPGGVVQSRAIGSVKALEQPQLSPYAMQALEMVEVDKEGRSGLSRLSKGMNKDAVSQQNASDMITRLTNSSNRRPAGEARDFAETFLVPLMRYIYVLGVRHDKRAYQIEVAGQQSNIQPQQWSEPAPLADVNVALTPEDGAKQAMALMQAHQMFSMDPHLQTLYGLQQRHAMADEMLDLLGINDASRFLMTPGSPEYQQAQDAMTQQMAQQKQEQMQQMQFQLGLMKSADQREWAKFKVDEKKTKVDVMNIASDNDREDEKLDHQKIIDMAEVQIKRRAASAKE